MALACALAACRPAAPPRSDGSAESPARAQSSSGALVSSSGVARTVGRAGGDSAALARADRARIQGSDSATLWVIEISDFQCPFCRQWHDSTYAALKREYIDSGKIRFAYINFPLPMHQNAFPAAEAAMCAAAQEKFWPMHDALFNSQDRWERLSNPRPFFDTLAARVGAAAPRMKACLDGHEMRSLVQSDFNRAEQAGVQSTPSFMLGTVGLAGAYPIADFRRILDSLLTAKP